MNFTQTFPNPNTYQDQALQHKNINKIEAFIISRVGQLKQFGWTTQVIAEALGVSEDFIERAAYLHSQLI